MVVLQVTEDAAGSIAHGILQWRKKKSRQAALEAGFIVGEMDVDVKVLRERCDGISIFVRLVNGVA